jgi:excisionase family DNA binding protein
MDSTNHSAGNPAFYTVPEAARILRVTPATLYRAIRDDAFPAVRIRTRYVIRPAPWIGWRPRQPGPVDVWTSRRWPLSGVPPAR